MPLLGLDQLVGVEMMDDYNRALPSNEVHEVIVDVHQDFLHFLTRRLGCEDEAAGRRLALRYWIFWLFSIFKK